MKTLIISIFFVAVSGLVNAQDTIFVRSGKPIVANIVEKNNTEIKYKRAGVQTNAIYSVFTADVLSIHYGDGTVADYTQAGKTEAEKIRPVDRAGTVRVFRFDLGTGVEYSKRNQDDALLRFWRYYTTNDATIGGNPMVYDFFVNFGFQAGRHHGGGKLDIMFTPPDGIYAINQSGSHELKYRNFYYNISVYYGHTLNQKKNLALMFEPGLDIGFLSGHIKLNNTTYNNQMLLGTGYHLGTGLTWTIAKRVNLSCKAGYKSSKVKESHPSTSSSTGYSTFYVNPTVSEELLTITWKGFYTGVGLSWSLYTNLKK